jgi:FAD/FMN-containing dehydrogenase
VDLSAAMAGFASEVGSSGPVTISGGGTATDVGGRGDDTARVVRAPSGRIEVEAAEMIVRVDAGVTLAELESELARHGQRVALAGAAGATVGGVLAVGRSGPRRLGDGPVRDALLGAMVVDHTGTVVTVGGSTVKNVTGYDLCRLMVGSLGTLACLGQATLRTSPIAERSQWVRGNVAPASASVLHRPVSVLWDGTATWALVEGPSDAVEAQLAAAAAVGLDVGVDAPPPLPAHRRSVRPGSILTAVEALSGPFVAEMGVGVVHAAEPGAPGRAPESVTELHRRLRDRFDPTRRLNPGREPLAGVTT